MLDKSLQSMGRLLSWISGGILLLMVFITLVDVFARLLWHPLFGATELTSYAMLIVASSAMFYTALQGANVTVRILEKLLSKRVNAALRIITTLFSMVIIAVIAWRSLLTGWIEQGTNAYSPTLSIPNFPFRYYLGFCFALIFLVLLRDLGKTIMEVRK